MKLLKFFFKFFLFRSLRKVKNIETVIQSHGFRIYTFRLEAKHDRVTTLIDQMGAIEYARHNICFIATNPIINGVFIKHNLSDDDRLLLLFHEEAHIWYNHPNVTSFTDETDTQQEKTANLFLQRLRILKAVFYLLVASTIFVAMLLFPIQNDPNPAAPLYTAAPQIDTDPITEELEEIEKAADYIATVYITVYGKCYHRRSCNQISDSDTITPTTITAAEQLGKTPCSFCCY